MPQTVDVRPFPLHTPSSFYLTNAAYWSKAPTTPPPRYVEVTLTDGTTLIYPVIFPSIPLSHMDPDVLYITEGHQAPHRFHTCTIRWLSVLPSIIPQIQEVTFTVSIVKETPDIEPHHLESVFKETLLGLLSNNRPFHAQERFAFHIPSTKTHSFIRGSIVVNVPSGGLSTYILDTDNIKLIQLDTITKPPLSAAHTHLRSLLSKGIDFTPFGIGGCNEEMNTLFRRAFATRVLDPQTIQDMGIAHVKGILLYGPPGTGKTLIARKIGEILQSKHLTVVNGPEILSKWVGESEQNLRRLFQAAKDDKDPRNIHVIVFDEIDALFQVRGNGGGGTVAARDGLVNQMLTMMDGVESPPNILVIGMTNRRELLDPALLRPGRMEIQIRIDLPNAEGRRAIMEIHTKTMREKNRLDSAINLQAWAERLENWSGAEIAGWIRAAASLALVDAMPVDVLNQTPSSPLLAMVTDAHLEVAMRDITPAFGSKQTDLFHEDMESLWSSLRPFSTVHVDLESYIHQVPVGEGRLLLIHGVAGCGLSTILHTVASRQQNVFVRVLDPRLWSDHSEQKQTELIRETFRQAQLCPKSIIMLDDVEEWIGYIKLQQQFSPHMLKQIIHCCQLYSSSCIIIVGSHKWESLFVNQLDVKLFFDQTWTVEMDQWNGEPYPAKQVQLFLRNN